MGSTQRTGLGPIAHKGTNESLKRERKRERQRVVEMRRGGEGEGRGDGERERGGGWSAASCLVGRHGGEKERKRERDFVLSS